MDGARHQFFPGAGFTEDQNSCIGGGDHLGQLLDAFQRRADAYYLVEVALELAEPLAHGPVQNHAHRPFGAVGRHEDRRPAEVGVPEHRVREEQRARERLTGPMDAFAHRRPGAPQSLWTVTPESFISCPTIGSLW